MDGWVNREVFYFRCFLYEMNAMEQVRIEKGDKEEIGI